jgi:hypothetical protein
MIDKMIKRHVPEYCALGLSNTAKFMYPDSGFNDSPSMCMKLLSLISGFMYPFMYLGRGHLKFSMFRDEWNQQKIISSSGDTYH